MSDYFVGGDAVLENKLRISDLNDLLVAEQEIVTKKTGDILDETPQTFDLDYLLHIHKVLFDDIYDFAGEIRTVDIAKPDASAPFAHAQFIRAEAKRIFDGLASKNYLANFDHKGFIAEITYLAADLNALHPFREGNGRTIRLYLIMLANHAGYLLDYSQVSADELIRADRLAFEGNTKPLLELYHKAVVK